MSQVIWNTIIPSVTSGNQLATLLNGFKDAVVSGFCGTSRPSQLQAGGYWIDQTNDAGGTWDYKLYDGTQDIVCFTINKVSGTVSVPGSASTFSITRTSDDTLGAILNLIKKRATGTGQTLANDDLGSLVYRGTQDDGTVVTMAQLRAFSRNNVTVSQQGSSLVFETINLNTSSLTEKMRLQDGSLGIGTTAPSETLHVYGTGIRADKASDDAVGAKIVTRKRRLAGTGAVQNSDVIFLLDIKSTDQTNAEFSAAEISVTASENHTSAAQGTTILIRNKDIGSATMTTKMTIANEITANVKFNATDIQATNITVTNLVATNAEIQTLVETQDANILLNKGGTQAGANAAVAGFTVQMSDATNAVLGYDSTLASKFKMGEVGNLKEIVDVSSAQQLANKSIQTPSRSDVKQGTESALTTYASTASNGQWCFATDTKVMYQVIDGALVPAGSGGGGGSLVWTKTGSASPAREEIDGFIFESFDAVDTQEIYTVIAVPSSYRPGKPIKLKGGNFFCNTGTGKVFFKAQAALIRSVTVLGTYPNLRTTTNTVVTVNAVANTNNAIGDLDLTDTSGQINGVAVAPGDKIRVRLYRDNAAEAGGAGSALEDARLIIDAFEVTFS